MILFIGNHRQVLLYCDKKGIAPTEYRLVRRYEDLRGYNPKDLPEVICIGDWYKFDNFSLLRQEAEKLGYKIKIIM